MNGLLPGFLRFNTAKDLIRLGRDHDGGYLVSRSDVDASDTLLSLGVNGDWSFEEDFCGCRDVDVLAYDASVGPGHFLKQAIKSALKVYNPALLWNSLRVLSSYFRFFRGRRRHVRKFVGHDFGGLHCSMGAVLDATESTNLFLKIDIEGAEYRVLDDLVQNADRIRGAVIEFHDCDLHSERIESFVREFRLPVVHIHANNHLPVAASGAMPLVLELTFSGSAVTGDGAELPHEFDRPNNPAVEEIILRIDR